MKIIKKAKLPTITCKICGCAYRPQQNDLKSFCTKPSCFATGIERRKYVFVVCPVCGEICYPFLEKGANDEQAD